jgi:hypothetical protein
MSRAINIVFLLLFLTALGAACGRTTFGTDEADAEVDEPLPSCTGDDDCDDGDGCNGVERCLDGECQPGTAVVCDDAVECTADTCTPSTGECVALPDHERCERGELCDPTLGCRGRACDDSTDCDDGYSCNGVEFCEGGTCMAGTPPSCDDGIACTGNVCDEAQHGCVATPDDSLCDDGRFCDGAEICDAAVGCAPGAPPRCDDGDPCTLDGCDEARGGCYADPSDADRDGFASCGCSPAPCDCDDGDSNVNPDERERCRDLRDNDCDGLVDCDDADCADHPRCGGTRCTSDEDCRDELVCNGDEVCGPDGRCQPGVPPDCNDGVTCTVDECVEAGGLCLSTPDDGLCAPDEHCDAALGCIADCDDDLDGDGFIAARCGGDDCDDTDRAINPAAAESCTGGDDEDCDGDADCDDVDCASLPTCCTPTGPEACDDDVDNDCDGDIDCLDLGDCRRDPICCVATGPEVCDDGVDNECDGFTDCSDFLDCRTDPACTDCTPELCWDEVDNDCDDVVDCDDSDCAWFPTCAAPPVETDCHNGIDDDLDGATDCDDDDCADDPMCPEPDTCASAIEIERAGTYTGTTLALADDYEPDTSVEGCAGGRGPEAVFFGQVPRESWVHVDSFGSAYDTVLYVREGDCEAGAQLACNDDTDGLQSEIAFLAEPGVTYYLFVDGWGDFSRGDYVVTIEITPVGSEICGNGIDDDLDGATDCDDADCAADPTCSETPERGSDACTDGLDNDGDGATDCDDVADCAVVEELGECCNGIDDNGNGVTDEFACACGPDAPCDFGFCYVETVGACGPSCGRIGGDFVCDWLYPGSYCSPVTDTCVY